MSELDVEKIFDTNGAIEAFIEAKRKGVVRFLGVTGHTDPAILKRCLEMFEFDTVMLPVNPAEPDHCGFMDVISYAGERDVGIIGMKVFLRALAERLPWYKSMEPFFRYALHIQLVRQ